jgi:Glycosyl hydrolases family 43
MLLKNQKMNKLLCLLIFILSTLKTFAQKEFSFDNANPRLDTKGQIVDAHDGRIIQFGKRYYWYGTKYGSTNGFTTANEYVCYSSDSLKNWRFEGALLPNKPTGVYYRPHVIFNEKTKKYILWYNWNPKLWDGQFGVAESTNPQGPFTIINDNVKVKNSAFGVGDLGLFVDDDKKAYVSYCTIQDHQVSVELLDENYTQSTLQGSEIVIKHCEAGGMFKRNNLYYLLTDYTCCFCTQGSGAQVFTATNPLGPYTYRQNINRYVGAPAPQLNDGKIRDNFFETCLPKDKNQLEIWFKNASKTATLTIHQFTGNRNGQCGEVENPILHQPILSYNFTLEYFDEGEWKPLVFNQPDIKKVSQLNTYKFTFAPVITERIRITPTYKDTTAPLLISEIATDVPSRNVTVYKTGNQWGKPVIPAQQTFVMPMKTARGVQYIWMGDLWGSASDNIKGHDYQYWSKPLKFYKNGLIRQLEWE